jgi:NADH:ubiquinone oxidoreductase subunit B-like Fe-S oxidoreductase
MRTPDPVDVVGCQVPGCLYRPESMPDAEITFLQADIIKTDSSGRANFRIAEA